MRKTLMRMCGVLVTPSLAFAAIAKQPAWGWLLLLISAASSCLLYFSTPFVEHVYGEVTSASVAGRLGATLLIPPTLMLKWLLYTGPLFLLVRPMAPESVTFRQLYAVVAHAESVTLLANAANLLLLHFRGVDALTTPGDLNAMPALGNIVRTGIGNTALLRILDQITPSQLWYLVVLAIGLATATQCGRRTALVLAGGVWFLGAALQVGLGALTEGS